jgi:hypothetical protein
MLGRVRAKSFSARIVLWVVRNSERREILGVPVMVPAGTRGGDETFSKITSAFDLLRDHGSRTLDDIRRYTNGVFVWVTAGALGAWHRDTGLVVLEESYVYLEGTSARDIASILVHETTHARLEAKGFAYSPELRMRIERVCFRRELAFARRLSEPGDLVAQAERQLQRPPDSFTHEAYRQRALVKLIELGVPRWLAKAMEWVARRRASLRRDVHPTSGQAGGRERADD